MRWKWRRRGEDGVKEKEEWLAAGVRGGELRAVESGTVRLWAITLPRRRHPHLHPPLSHCTTSARLWSSRNADFQPRRKPTPSTFPTSSFSLCKTWRQDGRNCVLCSKTIIRHGGTNAKTRKSCRKNVEETEHFSSAMSLQ